VGKGKDKDIDNGKGLTKANSVPLTLLDEVLCGLGSRRHICVGGGERTNKKKEGET